MGQPWVNVDPERTRAVHPERTRSPCVHPMGARRTSCPLEVEQGGGAMCGREMCLGRFRKRCEAGSGVLFGGETYRIREQSRGAVLGVSRCAKSPMECHGRVLGPFVAGSPDRLNPGPIPGSDRKADRGREVGAGRATEVGPHRSPLREPRPVRPHDSEQLHRRDRQHRAHPGRPPRTTSSEAIPSRAEPSAPPTGRREPASNPSYGCRGRAPLQGLG